jgi:AraC-like DNA-binding protein
MNRLVRSASLTHFAEVATQCGLDAPALVAKAGLPAACLSNPDLKIDAQATLALIEDAATRAAEPAFGVRMGERRRMSNIGPLAVALRDEPTLQHVLDVLVNHIRLHNEALVIQTQRLDPIVLIRLDILSDQGRYFRQGTELALLVTLQNISLFMGSQWRPRRVCFAHAAPESTATHRRIFGVPVEFGHDFTGIVCDSADLHAPNPSADPVMARYAEQFLQSLHGQPRSFQDQVRELVLLLLPLGQCNAQAVAEHLGCDRRTVNRRLAHEGLSFLRLVDAHRKNMARQYVEGGDLTLASIASQLGFSSRSALSRWYRQQFGVSPRGSRQA